MTDTPARLLRLLSLLQTPREWPGSELAERLAVSPRTIRRDIERLRDLGYPVEASRGAAGGYRLVAGTAMPPLLLDDEEAVAIAVGLRTAATHVIGGVEEASVRALAKLEQVLPSRLRHRVGALGAATVPLPSPYGDGPRVDAGWLSTLASAVAVHERVRFRYRTAGGVESGRLVEPHRLVAAERRWYLVAFDLERDDWRVFRVDRITEPLPIGVRFTPRDLPEQDAAAYLTRTMHALAPTYRAVATLQAPAEEVRARLGDRPGDVEPLDERSCQLRSHTDTLEWLAFLLIGMDCEFEVHEPPELVAYLEQLARRVTRATAPSQQG
ncbi:helix-turn-helix transcriptional regulator [Allostreptomyces psammosilenae]|uniref:Putative DNA-binding transcriptional regulator YafY n=1 Tax=Allostreptomyces psammosilenae TaxID=1892865 RepID=A0A853A4N9_9ACTN|nr:YafY family protein [Allostreptomyces psammosilenae]NYI05661.1 putative DNA-binding transcriptional regulator YafY [Allostreptomyces psammosilenae]